MTAKLFHFVEFYFPSEIEPKKIFGIVNRDLTKLKILDGAYAFRFFDVLMAQAGEIQLRSPRLNITGMHFIDARIMQIKSVLEFADPELTAQIEEENWRRAVYCRDDTYREFKLGDSIVPSKFKKNKE
ncbi:MAG: hypothetical protein HYV90_06035 [Candidatus Woesebacteria bacterium]|nr:MAG: hypothetical protein HYV90_06035 [Candidatus Woesebacteria bacterium]